MKVSMIAEYYTADSSSFSALELDAKNLQLHFNFTRCYVLLHNFFCEGVAENYSHIKQMIVLFLSENH